MLESRTMQPVLECRGNLVVVGTGEPRADVIDGNTYVTGDVDGDGVADFIIRLDGDVPLTAGDFIL